MVLALGNKKTDWKIALILMVLIAVGIAAFYYTNMQNAPKKSFEEEYASLASVWQNAGIKAGRFHEAFDEIEALPEGKITELKQGFEEFQTGNHGNAVKEIAKAYSLLSDIAIKGKKVFSLESKLSSIGITLEENCSKKKEMNEYANALDSLLEATKKYSEQANAVVAAYPSEAKSIALEEMPSSFEEEELAISELKNSLTALEKECP